MRLLNSCSGEMRDFISDDSLPPYAILSHTWGDEEVSFQAWQTLPHSKVEKMEGYRKIKLCCEQAVRHGLEWVWIDTCCIDKSSSAELSEAINSMFRWYQNAVVCYTHLADVPSGLDEPALERALTHSRWFTRGWTLQELLAPRDVTFYSDDWQYLGSKFELVESISTITRIDRSYLLGEELRRASISHRMSWAARRKTSRVEDIAYCLLGIFDINIPLIYGEGAKAFQRLQYAIIESYPTDHTLFAWGNLVEEDELPLLDYSDVLHATSHVGQDPGESPELLGMLAASPGDFEHSGLFVPSWGAGLFYRQPKIKAAMPIRTGPNSLTLDLVMEGTGKYIHYYYGKPKFRQIRHTSYGILLCSYKDTPRDFATITLVPCGHMSHSRLRHLTLRRSVELYVGALNNSKVFRCLEPDPRVHLQPDDIVIWRSAVPPGYLLQYWIYPSFGEYLEGENICRMMNSESQCRLFSVHLLTQHAGPEPPIFNIGFGRTAQVGQVAPSTIVEILSPGVPYEEFGTAQLDKKPVKTYVLDTTTSWEVFRVSPSFEVCIDTERLYFDEVGGPFVDLLGFLVRECESEEIA